MLKRIRENAKKAGVGLQSFFVVVAFGVPEQSGVALKSGCPAHLRKFIDQGRSQSHGGVGKIFGAHVGVTGLPLVDAVDLVSVGEKAIIRKLVLHVEKDQQEAGKSHGQAADVDQGVLLLLQQVAPGDFEIVAVHTGLG